MKNKEDIPKSIVVILVVLAVAISVLGTFTVLHELKGLRQTPEYEGKPSQTGKIAINVQDPNAGLSTATGKVTLKIEEQ